jgi:hypothetical protein
MEQLFIKLETDLKALFDSSLTFSEKIIKANQLTNKAIVERENICLSFIDELL